VFETASLLVVISALFAWLNDRFIRLPTTIGIMVIAMAFSVLLLALGAAGTLDPLRLGADWLTEIDFKRTLMDGMLAFLLFAGALHVDLKRLVQSRLIIGLLATAGVLISTTLIGLASYLLFHVLFIALLGIVTGAGEASAGAIAQLFAIEVIGGVVLGAVTGGLCWLLLLRIDNYTVEILLTLALVMGGYSLAQKLHVSGVLAMVIAGLMIGNPGRDNAMSDKTQAHLDTAGAGRTRSAVDCR